VIVSARFLSMSSASFETRCPEMGVAMASGSTLAGTLTPGTERVAESIFPRSAAEAAVAARRGAASDTAAAEAFAVAARLPLGAGAPGLLSSTDGAGVGLTVASSPALADSSAAPLGSGDVLPALVCGCSAGAEVTVVVAAGRFVSAIVSAPAGAASSSVAIAAARPTSGPLRDLMIHFLRVQAISTDC
jgi:hypothetical protein